MRKIIIDIPDELYSRAIKIAEKLNITFEELCNIAIEKYLDKHDEVKVKNNE